MSEKSQVPERYKKTELGIVPVEWEVEKLEDCCNKITDGSHFSPKSVEESDYKIATIANIDNNRFDLKSCKNISKDEYEKLVKNGCKPNIGDVLFSKDGTVGLCLVYKQEANLVLLSSIAIIPPKRDALESDFCAHMLKSDLILNEIIGRKTGTAIRRVVLRDLKTVKVPIPPIPEQQKIASILSKVDEQIEQTEQIIEKTEILKKGLMQRLLTKGIGHTKFKKTELGEIPEEWSIVKIQALIDKDIIFPNQDGNHGELHPKSTDYVIEGIPFIMVNNLSKNLIDLTNCKKISLEQANSLRIEPSIKGDVLISHKGTIGRTAIVQDSKYPFVVLTPQVTYYRVKNADKLYSLYLYYVFNSPYFQKMMNEFSKQSTRDFISISNQRKLNLILPESIKEQQKIASILSKVDSQIQDNQNYLTKLQELKKGLMQDLLTGKVRVRK